MKILVSCIPFDSGRSGISVYTREIIHYLQRSGHELTLIAEERDKKFLPRDVSFITAPKWVRHPVLSMLYHLFVLPFFIQAKRYDFCIIAAANRRVFAWYKLYTVAVVHDLAQYHIKNKYDIFRMIYLKQVLPFFIRRSPVVVAISESTKKDLIKFYKVKPEKIHVIYNGLTIVKPEKQSKTSYVEKYHLTPKKYLFYVSRIEHPGKNHLNVIRAFELLPEALRQQYQLVFAGSDWHGAEVVHEYAEKSVCHNQIIFTGFIDSADLSDAYQNAALYVFGSFYEGFGLSLCEAMYYQIPCCCSNTSSLAEIGRGAALLFEPSKPESIRDAIQKILENKNEIQKKLIAAGDKRWKQFDWQKTVEQIVDLYKKNEK